MIKDAYPLADRLIFAGRTLALKEGTPPHNGEGYEAFMRSWSAPGITAAGMLKLLLEAGYEEVVE